MGLIVGVGAGVPFGGAKAPPDLNDIAGGPFAWWNLQWLAGITFNGPDIAAIQGYKGTVHNLVQAVPAKQPVYEAAGWNGAQPSCQFDGVAEYMLANGVAAALSGDDVPFTMVLACQILTLAANKYIATAVRNVASGKGRQALCTGAATNTIKSQRDDDALVGKSAVTTEVVGTARHLITCVFTGATMTIYFDGVVTSVNAADEDVGVATLVWYCVAALAYGVGPTITAFANVRLAEHAVWSVPLSAPQVVQAGNILKTRWTGLP